MGIWLSGSIGHHRNEGFTRAPLGAGDMENQVLVLLPETEGGTVHITNAGIPEIFPFV